MYRYKIEVKNLNGIVTNLASFESKSEYINWIDKQESEERAFGIYFNKTEVTEEEFLSNLGELTPLYIEDFEVENSLFY
jgi:CRISPR/Cas system CMR-associated protein Cmr5 small subunit